MDGPFSDDVLPFSPRDITSLPLRTFQDRPVLTWVTSVIRGDSEVPYTFKGILVINIEFVCIVLSYKKTTV